ncbi:hypothetical protein F5Y10DRAFT_278468 [Nemania abortiva]|nr:hypothetical protein F5Y10DRAFT_278468 [Nemania abortiva]
MALATIYNRLPTLEVADERFNEREKMFAQLGGLLEQYGNVFGLCLVHAHCTISDDEVMLRRGNVSQPEKLSGLTKLYAERWMSSGEPYEFTTRLTTAPPEALLEAFNRLTSHVGVLGLYHIDKEDNCSKAIEHTEGRKNILMPYTNADQAHEATQTLTAWDFGCRNPVTMACNKVIVCDSRVTRIGSKHKASLRSI